MPDISENISKYVYIIIVHYDIENFPYEFNLKIINHKYIWTLLYCVPDAGDSKTAGVLDIRFFFASRVKTENARGWRIKITFWVFATTKREKLLHYFALGFSTLSLLRYFGSFCEGILDQHPFFIYIYVRGWSSPSWITFIRNLQTRRELFYLFPI